MENSPFICWGGKFIRRSAVDVIYSDSDRVVFVTKEGLHYSQKCRSSEDAEQLKLSIAKELNES